MSEHRTGLPTRCPGRITVEESFLDLIDQLAYGDLDTWRRIYASALVDPDVRRSVLRTAGMVDPDFAGAGALWQTLVERMPPITVRKERVAVALPPTEPPASEAAARARKR